MEIIIRGRTLSEEDLKHVYGGIACAREYCASDAGCGGWSKCISPTTYYGCSGGVLSKPVVDLNAGIINT